MLRHRELSVKYDDIHVIKSNGSVTSNSGDEEEKEGRKDSNINKDTKSVTWYTKY